MPATLGYVIATPTELPGVRTSQHRSPTPAFPKGKEPFKHTKTQQVGTPAPWEGTEKLKPTIKLKVDDGDIAVLPFIFCLF